MKKLLLVFAWSIIISPLFIFQNHLLAQPCLDNDDCANAIDIPNVSSGNAYTCIAGCNLFASHEENDNSCQIGLYPTVWYKVTLDSLADALNMYVNSDDFDQPVISLFRSESGCDALVPVNLLSGNLSCVIGSDGRASAIGTPAVDGVTYYIAVSSHTSIGGDFELCISTSSNSFHCVKDRNIMIVDRSNGGPLEGPFDPRETVSICLNVNQYTAAGNGCQWFQGIVPVFGNGWDPSSFDSLGQPFNATINGYPIGQDGNGIYGAATWIWTDSVTYHYDNPNITVADLDGNGRVDMCNSKYESDCPVVGVTGGCCGACWDSIPGENLPIGWFSYGINGTCPIPGPPISVDWGDGNTCGGGMGPWQICFDLVTRDVPDCMLDSTRRDLSLGMYTFADGEVGSWTGSASVCALDHPAKLTLEAKCGRISILPSEPLPPMCNSDTLRYKIEEPDVISWEWNVSPFSSVPYTTNQGGNSFVLETALFNTEDDTVEVKGILIGSYANSLDKIVRRFDFDLHNVESCPLVAVEDPQGTGSELRKKLRIYPTPTAESAILEWSFKLKQDADIHIYNSHSIMMDKIRVSSHEGYQKQIDTQSLEPGVYLVSLSNGDLRYVTKLVKL